MLVKKNDFIEIEFVGIIKDTREIFDTNIKEEAEKINLKSEENPLVICVGNGMLVSGFDKALEGKELNKKYKIEISPQDAFGFRNKELVKIIPLRVFKEKNVYPAPGMVLNLDGMLAKVMTISGGRVIMDFNNPLAGKDIEYEFVVRQIVEDENEKVNSLQDFFFRRRFEFEILGSKIIFKEEKLKPLVKMFEEKFRNLLGKEIEVAESSAK